MNRFKNHAKLSQSIVHGVLAICFAIIGLHAQLQPVFSAAPEPPIMEVEPQDSPGPLLPIPCGYAEVEFVPPMEEIPFPFPGPGPDPFGVGPVVLSAAQPGPEIEIDPCYRPDPKPTTFSLFLPLVSH